MHGAKHGNLKAEYTHPTVVLDHSFHIKNVKCSPGSMEICFKNKDAFKAAETSWNMNKWYIVAFHNGCGDTGSGKRSTFEASLPEFDEDSMCATTKATQVADEDALQSGTIRWGTYISPSYRKRAPVKGHIRMDEPSSAPGASDQFNSTTHSILPITNQTVDLTSNATALEAFFGFSEDFSHIHDKVPSLNFTSLNGTIAKRHWAMSERMHARDLLLKREGFWEGLWNGFKRLVQVSYLKLAQESWK